jgi:Flp pilus assembly protein TadG
VEFAAVAPVLFLLIFGIIEFARAFMVQQLLTEAARKGCRAAVVEGATSQQIKTAAMNCLNVVGITAETVRISINDAPLDSVDPSSAPANSEITVVVSVPTSAVSWLPGAVYVTGTISGQFTLRRF